MKQLTLFDVDKYDRSEYRFKCPYCGKTLIGEYVVQRVPEELWQKFCDNCNEKIGDVHGVQDQSNPIS